MRRAAVVLAAGLLTACGTPQRLPIGMSLCRGAQRGNDFRIVATVENKSTVPIARMDLHASFYQNFRYESYDASALLRPALDPGQKREVAFDAGASASSQPSGQAIRCDVNRIVYLDGTVQNAPPASGY